MSETKAASRKRRQTSGSRDFAAAGGKRRRVQWHRPPKNKQSFLLGGNWRDPLNLGGLEGQKDDDTKVDRNSVERPVHIDVDNNNQDASHHKRHRRKRRRHDSIRKGLQHSSGCFSDSELTGAGEPPPLLSPDLPRNTLTPSPALLPGKSEDTDKIAEQGEIDQKNKKQKRKDRFRYGNYNKYYGKRMENECDPRLKLLRKDWFEHKLVLDVGCNAGYITCAIAHMYNPKLIVGIDIDENLIGTARNSVLRATVAPHSYPKYPPSFAGTYGPLTAPIPPAEPDDPTSDIKYPKNVAFQQGNYVYATDDLLANVRAEYDCILALSITKWIHLNWADAGLKRFFRRAYANLKPGGTFVLEPQELDTYKKRSKMTDEMKSNYASIRFEPDHFVEYLLSAEVGFVSYENVGTISHKAKGFQRPILVFKKKTDEK